MSNITNTAAITYRCIKCHSRIEVEQFLLDPPKKPQPPRVRCPFCRNICAPADWLEQSRDKRGMLDEKALYRLWSNCPNAALCSLHDQYDHDCEEGRLMPKCLVAVHIGLESAPHLAQAAAQPKPRRRAQKKPDSGDPDT